MQIRDVILALDSYPIPTPNTVIDWSISFALQLDCRLAAFTADVSIDVPGSFLSTAFVSIPAMVSEEMAKCRRVSADLRTYFAEHALTAGVPFETIHEHCAIGMLPDLIADYARLRDLTIAPVPSEQDWDRGQVEALIFQSGRPVLLVPCHCQAPAALETVAIAWDFSRQAARAVGDALPLLTHAKTVRILCVSNEKTIGTTRSSAELAAHLSRHGIRVVVDEVDAAGRGIGDVMTGFVKTSGIDLVVMGAYGHSRLREFILGGATRTMTSKPPVPVLLSH